MAKKFNAVDLSQGFPDFDGPEEIRKTAADAIMRGPNQYVPTQGIPELRRAIARKMIVINNPQNPCGKVFTWDELEFIGSLSREFNALATGAVLFL